MIITSQDWAGEFGSDYTDRNPRARGRGRFWNRLIESFQLRSVLEVGCNTGANLVEMRGVELTGVDVNAKALAQIPDWIGVEVATADKLPFADQTFDLVLTFGVLIHVPPGELDDAMREIIRVSQRYVFAGEYYGDGPVEYRGGQLWRRDYGELYRELGLTEVEAGMLVGEPWDANEVHYWLMEKPSA